jgi:hypothetical protein
MPVRPVRRLAVAALVVGLVLTAAGGAWASPGPGTFTRITTPSGTTTFQFNGAPSATNHFTVSGQTSNDVTSVDIVCAFISTSGPSSVSLASAVPVTGGAFSTVVNYANPSANCRLRALPVGTAITDYLASYSGPILYTDALLPTIAGSKQYGYTAIAEKSEGVAGMADAGQCGVEILATIETPAMEVRGPGSSACHFGLGQNLAGTASAVRVSGHNTYLPSAVHDFLRGTQALTVTQTVLTTSFHTASNGDVTLTESAPLKRCSVSDAYPPTSVSCPSLVSAGVTITRVSHFFRGGHQVRIRDTFNSTDGASHTVSLQYANEVAPAPTGSVGFRFPGHGSTFRSAIPDQTVTGLGTKAASMFVRSDRYSAEGDPEADTVALTWSRAPSRIVFAHSSADLFSFRYSLGVPANGRGFLGFADSESVTTSGAKSLGTLAVRDMMRAPSITSPSNGAVLSSTTTTVKGKLTAGANGLPTSVTVNGHHAAVTTTSLTTATYRVRFSEPVGKHKITATAHDVAGNTRSRSIRVRNT